MTIELDLVMPSDDERGQLIHEAISLLRMGLSDDRDPGDGDLFMQTYGILFKRLEGDSVEELLQKLANAAVGRLVATAAVAGQLAVVVANLRGENVQTVLDNLEIAMVPDPDGSSPPGSGQ